MSPTPSAPGAAPLPPLPVLSSGGQAAPGGNSNAMASILSGVAPVKHGVEQIVQACQQIVQSGAVPGAEQPCSQIIALATSLLPMAVQQMMGPQGAAPPPPQTPMGPIGG